MKLVIGNRNYSSWSLRAWLMLRESGASFDEILIPLFTGNWRDEVARYGDSGRVPILIDGDIHVWDTLAIVDHVQRRVPDAVSWPETPDARARAWSIAAEMHSGFLAVRGELPQNLRRREPLAADALSADARTQIARIDQIWHDTLARHGGNGPWLFGRFSVADIMFAPVALRFVSYGIDVSPGAQPFVDAVLAHEGIKEWIRGAEDEHWAIDFIDDLTPAADAPLVLG